MLVISNGMNTLTVTKGAYKSLYKYQGYEVVSEAGASAPAPEDESLMSRMPQEARTGEGVHDNTPEDENASDGFREAENGSSNEEDENPEESPVVEEEEKEEDLSEIPLSEMTVAQLKAYAREIGVVLDGTETKRELKQLIIENLG